MTAALDWPAVRITGTQRSAGCWAHITRANRKAQIKKSRRILFVIIVLASHEVSVVLCNRKATTGGLHLQRYKEK